jgi:hypothetical protein
MEGDAKETIANKVKYFKIVAILLGCTRDVGALEEMIIIKRNWSDSFPLMNNLMGTIFREPEYPISVQTTAVARVTTTGQTWLE